MSFAARLNRFPPVAINAVHLDRSNAPPSIDGRCAHLVNVNGAPHGIVSGVAAQVLVKGVESDRLLSALSELLEELTRTASQEAIAAHLRELIQASDLITQHLNSSRASVHGAIDAMELELTSEGGN